MARPRKDNDQAKGQTVTFRLTPDELAQVDDRAKRAGMTRSAYVRRMALRGRITVRTSAKADFQLVAALNRIGVNLNQLTRTANQNNRLPAPPELRRLCKRIEELVARAADSGASGGGP